MISVHDRPRLEHLGASEIPFGAVLLEETAVTDLSDQQKLAVVLQAAALLSHTTLARQVFGEPPATGKSGGPFSSAALDRDGRLWVGPLRPGSFAAPTQQLLAELLRMLFHSHSHGQVAGRGVARRAARQLLSLWSQELVPLAADRAVAQIFAAAPFLWLPAFSVARGTVAAALSRPGESRLYLLIAGPGGARRRFQKLAKTLDSARALLEGNQARELFEGADAASDPQALLAAGKPLLAIAAWRHRPPADDLEKIELARTLLGLGLGQSAAETLEGLALPAARLLRARALLEAGERHAAEKALQFEARLFPALALERTDLEVALLAGRGELDAIRRKMPALLAAATARPEDDPLRLEAFLIAAGAAWDCGDRQAMNGYLEAARAAEDDPRLGWRICQLRALAALEVGDGLAAAQHARAALRGRRRLTRSRAGRLWNDLAVARASAGDLGGAERAARHAFRLLAEGEGSSALALALANLAEVRLRRGRFAGVEATLERSIAQNRLAGNIRSLLRDLEMMARLELGLGRPAAALARCAEALGHNEATAARQDVFELFAARAHGWLGRPDAAALCLARGGLAALTELEPEERPAVFALAGRDAEALREAHGTPWQELWQALVAGEHPPSAVWLGLASLEPYRAARLLFDAERRLPGVVPRQELKRAVATLRAAGAEALAENLDVGARSLATALRLYTQRPAGDPGAAAELLVQAGYGEVVLSFRPRAGFPLYLAPAKANFGGSDPETGEVRSLPCAGGELVLHVKDPEPALDALFSLLRRDLEPELEKHNTATAAHDGPAVGLDSPFAVDGIYGRDQRLLQAVRRLDAFAETEVAVLVLGESGCGKELFARRLHRKSRREKGPFLAVNCAALSESLILSDLFGHVRGGFTGADRDRAGIFESARGGTVFLDEIGDLPLSCQGHLLRVLQESEIRRVGESFTRKVDVRIVTATHRDLDEEVAAGRFRLDLFYRLRAATVMLPPLRERLSDLPLLAEHFLGSLRPGKKRLRLSKEATSRLLGYGWPGNIRELKNLVEVAAALAEGDEIRPQDIELPTKGELTLSENAAAQLDYHEQIEAFRRRLVREALHESRGHRAEAARRLGLSRQALSYLIRQLGLL